MQHRHVQHNKEHKYFFKNWNEFRFFPKNPILDFVHAWRVKYHRLKFSWHSREYGITEIQLEWQATNFVQPLGLHACEVNSRLSQTVWACGYTRYNLPSKYFQFVAHHTTQCIDYLSWPLHLHHGLRPATKDYKPFKTFDLKSIIYEFYVFINISES